MNYELIFNGQTLDYTDAGGLDLTLSKMYDDMPNFAGSFGDFAANIANSLELPATANNRRVLLQPYDATAANYSTYNQLGDLQIAINGATVYFGKARVSNALAALTYAQTITLEVNPSSTGLFAALEDLQLRDLDMGSADTNRSDILASHTAVNDTANPLVWQPVNYGGSPQPNNSTDLIFNLYDDKVGARPCVRVRQVLDAIAANLGYTIQSDFIATESFRNVLEAFTVGSDWERSDNWQDYKAHVKAEGYTATSGSRVNFTTIVSDPMNLFGVAGYFIAPINGYYQFEIFVTGGVDYLVQVEYWEGIILRAVETIATTPSGQETIINPLDFYNPKYRTRLAVRLNSATPTFTADGYIKVNLTKQAILGAPLRISSCLPDVSAKSYLAALRHLYGWVVSTNELLKIIYIEPRFINPLPDTHSPNSINPNKSYYKVNNAARPLKVDIGQGINISHQAPFGDKLLIALGEDNDNVAIKRYKADLAGSNLAGFGSPLSDVFAVELGLANLNLPNQQQRNPLFTPCLNYELNVAATPVVNRAKFPLICEDEGLLQFKNETEPTYPTYKAKPKLLQYYGKLDFNEPGLNYYYVIAPGWRETVYQDTNVPTAFQIFPDDENYLVRLNGQPSNLIFSTLTYTKAGTGKVFGLFDRFYFKYAALMYKDTYLDFSFIPSLSDFIADRFNEPVSVEIQGQIWKGWLVKVQNFSPAQSRLAQATVVIDHDVTTPASGYGLAVNPDKPVLQIQYFLKIINDLGYP